MRNLLGAHASPTLHPREFHYPSPAYAHRGYFMPLTDFIAADKEFRKEDYFDIRLAGTVRPAIIRGNVTLIVGGWPQGKRDSGSAHADPGSLHRMQEDLPGCG